MHLFTASRNFSLLYLNVEFVALDDVPQDGLFSLS
jgi:hypothetical protein